MSIDTLRPKPKNAVRFGDLPPALRLDAEQRLRRLASRYPQPIPRWRWGLLAACCRRHVVSPLTSRQARAMLARRAGLASQQSYRRRGVNPTERARAVLKAKRVRREPAPPARLGVSLDPVFHRVRDTAVGTVNDTSQGGRPPSVTSSDALIARKRLLDLATQIPTDDAPDERMWPNGNPFGQK